MNPIVPIAAFPHRWSRMARCVDCRELFLRTELEFVVSAGLFCELCRRWRRLDLMAAVVS
jgi:hypothetical protein